MQSRLPSIPWFLWPYPLFSAIVGILSYWCFVILLLCSIGTSKATDLSPQRADHNYNSMGLMYLSQLALQLCYCKSESCHREHTDKLASWCSSTVTTDRGSGWKWLTCWHLDETALTRGGMEFLTPTISAGQRFLYSLAGPWFVISDFSLITDSPPRSWTDTQSKLETINYSNTLIFSPWRRHKEC